ncbi:MAG: outer membrane beta-barrel protein [Prevotella sp.]|nr:outer membrane beta-barrel protein [Prevotella sp.]
MTDHNVVVDNNLADNAETKAPVPAASDHADTPSATDNNTSDIPSATNPSAHTTQPSSDFGNQHSPTEGIGTNSNIPLRGGARGTRAATLALYGTNGLADSKNANGVRMAEPMASRYAMAAESMKRGAPTPVIYMAGYEEREQHRQPFSVGLSVGIPIGQRWTVTTGLAYTQLHADFLKIMNKRKLATEQDLQYVGCPVNLNYSILQTKRLRAYAAAGAQMDVNVKAKSVTEGVETEMKKDRLQLSTQAAVGLQLDVMPQVGVYVEPGVKYYFDNNSNVSTFFKDKPCNFNLQVGLRWNFEH